MKEYLEIGKIVNTHGIAGEIKLEPWCDSPDDLKKISTVYVGTNEYRITSVRILPNGYALVKIDDINDIDAAMTLKNKVLTAHSDTIPKKDGAIFIADLIGLDVIDAESGEVYGTLSDVIKPAAQELYVITTPRGDVMIPNVDAFIKKRDTEKGIFISAIPGLFDIGDNDEI
ncbi:MAG: ribosome maturation factor RimM [Clostridia bacterium]|nr:ribosome maturation factor RimM [Clostridia bacterium]